MRFSTSFLEEIGFAGYRLIIMNELMRPRKRNGVSFRTSKSREDTGGRRAGTREGGGGKVFRLNTAAAIAASFLPPCTLEREGRREGERGGVRFKRAGFALGGWQSVFVSCFRFWGVLFFLLSSGTVESRG